MDDPKGRLADLALRNDEPLTHVEHIEIPENAVIVFRDPDGDFGNEGAINGLIADMHERFPKNLVVWLAEKDSTLETLPVEQLKSLLAALIEHEENVADSNGP